MTKTTQVVAPSNLDAGYQFEAQVDGKSFMVTVPEGGVKEGQTFEVPYPEEDGAAAAAADDDMNNGKWKVGLFDTCDPCTALWWMGFCCNPCLMAQVMQRLGLDPLGGKMNKPDADKNSMTCAIVTIITIVCSFIYFLRIALVIYVLVFGIRYRMYMRQKYNLAVDNCGGNGLVEDCCCVFWCSCCVACQTHRQTHDETKYPYSCFTATGLDESAPSIV